jgi:hypothetical protein
MRLVVSSFEVLAGLLKQAGVPRDARLSRSRRGWRLAAGKQKLAVDRKGRLWDLYNAEARPATPIRPNDEETLLARVGSRARARGPQYTYSPIPNRTAAAIIVHTVGRHHGMTWPPSAPDLSHLLDTD